MFTVKENCRISPFIAGPDVVLNMPYVHYWPLTLYTEGPVSMNQEGADIQMVVGTGLGQMEF